MKTNIILFCLLFTFLTSCEDYKKEEGCHLDNMGLKGNVVRVETIVQSSMPLTEIYAKAFDPQYALSMYAGNLNIEFDKKGNVRSAIGYGIDGNILFETNTYIPANDVCSSPAIPIGPNAKQYIDRVETVTNSNGDVVNVKYYDGEQLIWNQKANYNIDGSVKCITKEYESLSIKSDFYNIVYADTTLFDYIKYDSQGNWIEVRVDYNGIFPKHKHSYKIKRQITYWNEKKKSKLIKSLSEYNIQSMASTKQTSCISLGCYGNITIPDYMVLQSQTQINDVRNVLSSDFGSQLHYLFMSVYDDNDSYATLSVNLLPGDGSGGFDNMTSDELKYDKDTDEYLEELNTQRMAQNDIYILKWLPYQFVTISGKRALCIKYYRYGIGSPIPVYCENYTIPMSDGNIIGVIFSFQSNLYNRFYKDFKNSISSIRFR